MSKEDCEGCLANRDAHGRFQPGRCGPGCQKDIPRDQAIRPCSHCPYPSIEAHLPTCPSKPGRKKGDTRRTSPARKPMPTGSMAPVPPPVQQPLSDEAKKTVSDKPKRQKNQPVPMSGLLTYRQRARQAIAERKGIDPYADEEDDDAVG